MKNQAHKSDADTASGQLRLPSDFPGLNKDAGGIRRYGKYRLSEHISKGGSPSFRATWWEGHKHKSMTFTSAQARWQYILESQRGDKSAAAIRSAVAKQGDYLAVFAQLAPDVQLALLGAWDRLRAAGGTAEDITAAAQAHADTMGGGITVGDAVARHLGLVRERLSPKSFLERRCNLAHLVATHGTTPLCALSRGKCHDWIESGKSAHVRLHRHAALSAFLNDCIRREWLRDFPMRGFQKPSVPSAEAVAILSPDEAERLLRQAEQDAQEMVPFFAIGLFAGLRPERELRSLVPDNIDVDGGVIYVSCSAAKIRINRDVPISDNLAAWLRAYPIPADGISYSRRLRRKIGIKADVHLVPDILRHTCASYRLALTRDPVRTADELGNSVDILKRHYANRKIAPADVERFWGILPSRPAKS